MSRILVVEDDPHNAILFRKVLEKRGGFQVTLCDDGDEILRLAREGGWAMVVMDVSLGNTKVQGQPVNGIDLCQRLKAEPATATIPVVLATAHAMRGDAQKLMAESGADDYVAKPIVDHEAFVALVRRNLRAEAA